MKFMVMHKADANSEAEAKPSQALIANVGNLLKGAMEAGTFVDGAGLRSSARRVRYDAGSRELTEGPFASDGGVVSNVALFKVKDMPEAIAWSTRFAEAAGARAFEVGPVTEPWDLGVAPKPEGEVPLQALALLKAEPGHEAERAAEAFLEEARTAGVLVGAHALLPSDRGARLQGSQGSYRVSDGPFAEAKELVGGFMILQFASKVEAVEFAQRYAGVVGASEVDIREVR